MGKEGIDMKYNIVSEQNFLKVIVLVNNYLGDGYELYGELIVTEVKESTHERAYLVYSQVLILKEDTNK
jgi:hypothetical protein